MNALKLFIKAFAVGLAIYAVILIVLYANGYSLDNYSQLASWLVYNQIYAVSLYIINAYYFRLLLRMFSFNLFKAKNLVIGAIGGVFLTVISLFLIRMFLKLVVERETLSMFFEYEELSSYYLALIISIAVTSIFYAVYYYKNKQDKKVVEQRVIAGKASASFDALKNQLDPHFLFNSLNVLTSLIHENQEAATRFTTSLSKVYRYVLEQKNKELVTLQEEMDFAKLYMSLLSVRFEDSIVFSTPDLLKNPGGLVVPMSLQLLIENAVKHNQVTPLKKLFINIQETDGRLVVSNNLQSKKVLKEGTGVGLKNIQDRYSLISSLGVNVLETQDEFAVSLPILIERSDFTKAQETYISEKRYNLATKKVQELKVFYIHLALYLLSVPAFLYLNYISNTRFLWSLFPICGWGLGVASHAMEVFDYNPLFGKEWEEKKIREFMKKDK